MEKDFRKILEKNGKMTFYLGVGLIFFVVIFTAVLFFGIEIQGQTLFRVVLNLIMQ